jgi:hypothetical protein
MELHRAARAFGLAAAAVAAPALASDIYTWVDETGAVNYSTTPPEDVNARVFKGSPAGVPAPVRAAPAPAAQPAEPHLVERINKLEADLDKERDARFALLERQLDQQREETRRLQQDRDRVLDAYGPSQPALWSPDVVYVVPTYRPHKKKHDKHDGPKKPIVERDAPMGYPPLSSMPSFRPNSRRD